MAIWRMRTVRWIIEATDTHSEYVILIAFPLQQWLHERASFLHLYVHCLSCFEIPVRINDDYKKKQSRYRPGVAQRVQGS
jgi:hypothetical protein